MSKATYTEPAFEWRISDYLGAARMVRHRQTIIDTEGRCLSLNFLLTHYHLNEDGSLGPEHEYLTKKYPSIRATDEKYMNPQTFEYVAIQQGQAPPAGVMQEFSLYLMLETLKQASVHQLIAAFVQRYDASGEFNTQKLYL